MTIKEYLSRAKVLSDIIEDKILYIEMLENMVGRVTTSISDMPGSPSRDVHRNEEIISKIVDLKKEVQADIEGLMVIESEIINLINELEDINSKRILTLRYLLKYTWKQIVAETGFSKSSVHRIHGSALLEAERKYNR